MKRTEGPSAFAAVENEGARRVERQVSRSPEDHAA